MEPLCRLSTSPVLLRFYSDFEIATDLKAVADFSPEQLTLLESILATPSVKVRFARMALETDLNSLADSHFIGKYRGPSDRELLDCALPCLPYGERYYWESLRDEPGDALHNQVMPVFFVFGVRLKNTNIEELSS